MWAAGRCREGPVALTPSVRHDPSLFMWGSWTNQYLADDMRFPDLLLIYARFLLPANPPWFALELDIFEVFPRGSSANQPCRRGALHMPTGRMVQLRRDFHKESRGADHGSSS